MARSLPGSGRRKRCRSDCSKSYLRAIQPELHPLQVRFNAVFASDIGHWDVPDITEVTAEAHELVEKGLITEDDFRSFVFTNPASLWTGMNPDFFKGTVVERAVESELGSPRQASAGANQTPK